MLKTENPASEVQLGKSAEQAVSGNELDNQIENGLIDRAEVSNNLNAPSASEDEDNAPARKAKRIAAKDSTILDLTAIPLGDEETPPSVAADQDAATAPAVVAESSVNTLQEVTGLELTIDPQFEALCPRLPEQEGEYLREGLKKDGQINQVIFWEHKGKNIIVDGHNRFRILKELGVQDVKTLGMNFEDRGAAVTWIIKRQLGRRNLSPIVASYFRGKLLLDKKGTWGGDRKSKVTNGPLVDTATDLARQTGVSRSKIKCEANFAKAVQVLGIEADVISGVEKRRPSQIIQAAFPGKVEVPMPEIESGTDAAAVDDPYRGSVIYKDVQSIVRAIRRIPWEEVDSKIIVQAKADIERALPKAGFNEFDPAAAPSTAKMIAPIRRRRKKEQESPDQTHFPFENSPAAEGNAIAA